MKCITLKGAQRSAYQDVVWDMFVLTYRTMGLILSNPSELFEYDIWKVCFHGEEPVSFSCFKSTPFGKKSGLSGHNGSAEGKSQAVKDLREKYLKPGYYGEVSHKVEQIALAAGAPVVCASYVPSVLKKQVDPQPDGVHYARSLPGVGRVVKALVGNPKGIPTTSSTNPSCPAAVKQGSSIIEDEDDLLMEHFAAMLFE